MADDAGASNLTAPETGMLDRERKDLLDKGDMLKLFRYLLDEQVPKDSEFSKLFFVSSGKGVGSTFLVEGDESQFMTRLEMSIILYNMKSPRSEKKMEDYIALNELRSLTMSNIRKSQGFKSTRTNLMTLFSTIVKHNIHSMTDQTQKSGFMGGIGRMFGKI